MEIYGHSKPVSKHRNGLAFCVALCAASPILVIADPAFAADAQSAVNDAFQKMWQKGSDQVRDGTLDLSKAQERLASANLDIANAQTKQANGVSNAATAAEAYHQLTATPPAIATSVEAIAWADKLTAAANLWRKADKDQNGGSRDLQKSTQRQQQAQNDIIKAQAKIDAGRATMADAQRRSGSTILGK